MGSGQHIQCDLFPADGALDRRPVHDGIRPHAGVTADQRPAQIDLVVRKAHGQAVTQKGRVRKIVQVHLPAAGLTDDAGVVGLDHRSGRILPGRAKGLQRDRLCVPAAVRRGAVAAAVTVCRFALHGQWCQNVLCNAAGRRLRRCVLGRCTVFQNGGNGVGQHQNGQHHPCQAQLAAHAAVTGTVRCRMIFV